MSAHDSEEDSEEDEYKALTQSAYYTHFLASVDGFFTALANVGVLAQRDFTCCNTCGVSDIKDAELISAIESKHANSPSLWGYLFYHDQAGDAAKENMHPGSGQSETVDILCNWGFLYKNGGTETREAWLARNDELIAVLNATADTCENVDISYTGPQSKIKLHVTIPYLEEL